ncbi:hypothetical protein RJT34_12653 [Clitoria ternatea]|uniref:Uncharacterized protein n=1 Tax=Clitoria ternatea TaxID=43366 RepID=A0AAN9JMK7_CLITE
MATEKGKFTCLCVEIDYEREKLSIRAWWIRLKPFYWVKKGIPPKSDVGMGLYAFKAHLNQIIVLDKSPPKGKGNALATKGLEVLNGQQPNEVVFMEVEDE